MALKVNINVKNFPLPVKIIIGAIPAVAIIAAVLFLLILPKNKEIRIPLFLQNFFQRFLIFEKILKQYYYN